ncbi:MAG: hypothetical protein JSW60_08010, partial [Thermoplasmatales archaeon]
SIPLNVSSTRTFNSVQENKFNNGMKTLFMKGECEKIILYKVWWYPVHIGPFWFTSEHAYLAFLMYEDFILKINGVDQDVELPAMVIPWRFIGLGPLFWIRCIVNPCNHNFTLIGTCEDVIINPLNYSITE